VLEFETRERKQQKTTKARIPGGGDEGGCECSMKRVSFLEGFRGGGGTRACSESKGVVDQWGHIRGRQSMNEKTRKGKINAWHKRKQTGASARTGMHRPRVPETDERKRKGDIGARIRKGVCKYYEKGAWWIKK